MKKLTIEKMQEIAKIRDGKCLSVQYENAHTKLKWQCSVGHEWEAIPCNISQGKWCPYCKSGKNEERCRFILEQLTGFIFLKTRTTINGELDGFCKHLNLAFEYQGIQHFKDVPFFRNNLEDIQSRDRVKRKECKQKNIYLIEIPYFVAELGAEKLEQYIRGCISKYTLANVVIDYSEEKSSLINRINRLRKQDGLMCVSIHRTTKGTTYVKMRCHRLHEWIAQSPSIIYSGYGCPFCAGYNRTIDDVKLIATERGGECLSKTYISAITKMRWKCSRKHEWMATLNKILCGRWCPECAIKSRVENRRLNKGWSYEIIRRLYINGKSIKDICSQFNICSVTVKRAIKEDKLCN